jgi:hypothetical protein
MNASPPVSIGLPVYNGEDHLAAAIESLLAQDYDDFELHICDNASTDSTAAIARRYSALDRRVRVHRNATNIGAAANFNRTFTLASGGPYFMWAAHDDLRHPHFLRRCVEHLERHPAAVLCTTDAVFVDEAGVPLDPLPLIGSVNRLATEGFGLRQRVSALTEVLNWYSPIYGVVRTNALRATSGCPNVYGGDVVLLLELLLLGETHTLPEQMLTYRLIVKGTARQVAELSGGSRAVAHPYHELTSALLQRLAAAGLPPLVIKELRDDLIANVTCHNRAWREQLLHEHPNLRRLAAPLQRAELALLLQPELPATEQRHVRRGARRELLASMAPWARTRYVAMELYGRHLGWRLRRHRVPHP